MTAYWASTGSDSYKVVARGVNLTFAESFCCIPSLDGALRKNELNSENKLES
jgi:hypothetical protein